ERAAAAAASRGDAVEERLQRTRAGALRAQLTLLDDQLTATTVRAPVSGIVLTPRPEERLGAWLDGGDLVVTLGRTDTLELVAGVRQRDIDRVAVGQTVRLRVEDRKSTRLNSSHVAISYAVFCLKKKKKKT